MKIIDEKSVGQSNPITYLMLILNSFNWTLYGLIANDFVVIISSVFGILFGIIYSIIFYIYLKNKSVMKRQTQYISLSIIVLLIFGYYYDRNIALNVIGLFGCITAFLLISSPLTNIKKVYKYKTSQYLPTTTVIAGFICSFSWFIYGINVNDTMIYLTNII